MLTLADIDSTQMAMDILILCRGIHAASRPAPTLIFIGHCTHFICLGLYVGLSQRKCKIEVQNVRKKFAVGCENLLALSISFPVAQRENRKEFFTHKRDICCTLPQHSNTHSTTTKMTCTGVLPMWVGSPDTAT